MAKFCFRSKRTGGREAWIDDRWLIKCLNFGVLFLFFWGGREGSIKILILR